MAFTGITDAEREVCGVSQLPDSPQVTSTELKTLFDSLGNLAIDKFILHLTEIADETAASNIGASVPEGFTANKQIQSVINALATAINANTSAQHTHANMESLNGITSDVKTGYDDLVVLLDGIASCQTSFSASSEAIATTQAIAAYVAQALSNSGFLNSEAAVRAVYPIGTVFSTYGTTNPNVLLGVGTWVLIDTVNNVSRWRRTV